MGFVTLVAIGLLTAALLWRLRVARPLWTLLAAGLMLAATGYTLQGRPALAGHPVTADAQPIEVDPALVELRDRLFGRFTGDGAYLIASDAMMKDGDTRSAVWAVLGGIRKFPGSALLWTGLGDALALHDGGTVSPPSLFAFQQAVRLAPRHPGPPFFLGLAYVRAGQFADAEHWWRLALALTPTGSDYRPEIAVRLALLQRVLAVQRTPVPPGP